MRCWPIVRYVYDSSTIQSLYSVCSVSLHQTTRALCILWGGEAIHRVKGRKCVFLAVACIASG